MNILADEKTDVSHTPSINLNLNVRGLKPSATLAINELSAELIAEGRDIIKFGLGQSPFPVAAPVVEALQENAFQKDYLPVKGLFALRETIAEYHCRKHSINRKAENVLIGPGSKELMFLIQLAYYGDLVIPTPSWVSYAPQAQIIGRRVHWMPTNSADNWRLMPEQFASLCREDPDRPRLLILNYPNNPTGHTYSREQLKELAEVARNYRVVLLSDEIYGEIHHEGMHTSIAEFYPEGTIVSTGLSKWCGAGGWRLGSFTFPDSLQWLLDAMAVVASETYTATSAPIQYAAIRAFQGGKDIDAYLVQSRRALKAIGVYCYKKMKKAGIKIHQPQGAFYLFPSFSPFKSALERQGIKTNRMLCERILQDTGVATLPGGSFGRPDFKFSLRLAYVDFNGANVLAEAGAIALDEPLTNEFVEKNCPKVSTGIERLCSWANDFK